VPAAEGQHHHGGVGREVVGQQVVVTREVAGGQAGQPGCAQAAARYGDQASGLRGVATSMNTSGRGGRGCRRGYISISWQRESALRALHGAHEVTTFIHDESPPRLRGTTWSTVSLDRLPQYWHS